MKQTEIIMGMPITVEIIDSVTGKDMQSVFEYFRNVDSRYSTYQPSSEISQINDGLPESKWSPEMKTILKLCEQTKQQTNGYFDIRLNGRLDPSGLVKGWAINNAAKLLRSKGFKNFYLEAGGDIQTHGTNAYGEPWAVGIRNPFNINEIIKVVKLSGKAIATSGTYIRGQHIYNPLNNKEVKSVKSLTVVGPNIYDADRYATAAFAMGTNGINFIESIKNLDGYLVDETKIATYTSGFAKYTEPANV